MKFNRRQLDSVVVERVMRLSATGSDADNAAKRLVFLLLLTIADREGRLKCDHSRLCEACGFKYVKNFNDILNTLVSDGAVIRYTVGADDFLQIIDFEKMQHPKKTAKKSVIPPRVPLPPDPPPIHVIRFSESINLINLKSKTHAKVEEKHARPPDAGEFRLTGEVSASPEPPYDEIVRIYEATIGAQPGMPAVRLVGDALRKKIRARWGELQGPPADRIAAIRGAMEKACGIDGLMGRAPLTDTGRFWRMGIHAFFEAGKMEKILAGGYDWWQRKPQRSEIVDDWFDEKN